MYFCFHSFHLRVGGRGAWLRLWEWEDVILRSGILSPHIPCIHCSIKEEIHQMLNKQMLNKQMHTYL